jgi:glycosyltransferase involved in cell wall biosynthesis
LGLRKNFVFTGLVAPEEIPRYLGIMDMLVHLSRREGLARALPQALAASRPVIAYDCDGAGEVCLPEETGFLVRPGDLDTLVERMAQLAQDRALRERMGARGRELVRPSFSVETMVENLCTLYGQLAATRLK